MNILREQQSIWKGWSNRLNELGLGKFAASFLEASGPLNLVAAQFVYIGKPILTGLTAPENLNALATMLEDPEETSAFVAHLREADEWTF